MKYGKYICAEFVKKIDVKHFNALTFSRVTVALACLDFRVISVSYAFKIEWELSPLFWDFYVSNQTNFSKSDT